MSLFCNKVIILTLNNKLMVRTYDTSEFTIKSFFIEDGQNYNKLLSRNWIDREELFSLMCRNLWSTECVGEFFREQTGRVLSTEEYLWRSEKIPGEFLSPVWLDTCIWNSKLSQLVVTVKKDTNALVWTTLSYVTSLENAYSREFKTHYPDSINEFKRCIESRMPSSLYNVFGNIWVSMDISPRLRLRLMLKMLSIWARHMLDAQDTIVPCLAEMNKWVKRGNAFFRSCIEDFKVEELQLADKSWNAVLAQNTRAYYHSIVAIFWKDTIINIYSSCN